MNQLTSIARFRMHLAPGTENLTFQHPILSVENLSINDRQGLPLVNNISFQVPAGGTIGIVGESGSGKSLTCRAILGLLPPGLTIENGAIRYRDLDLARLEEREWRGLRALELAAVFQDPASYLNPSIRVGHQMVEALRATLGLDRANARDRALSLLRRVGLNNAEAVFRHYPFELSGGMAQRVLIAIALGASPKLLIADEATTALDVTVQAEVLALLDTLRKEEGLTLIMVSHDLAVVSQVCDHVLVMRDGAVVEAGATSEVLANPRHDYTRSLIANHHRYAIEEQEETDNVVPFAAPAPPTAPPLLDIRGLRASYGDRPVLDDINLRVDKGEIVGLIGETGTGKTTILRSIIGLVRPHDGSIIMNGQDIGALRGKALRKFRKSSQIQYVFQDPLRSLDPDLPIGISVGEGLDIGGDLPPWERDERVIGALQAVGLDPRLASRFPRQLSGGQRQRAVIARALVLGPQLLLLDEPVSALDAVSRIHVLELMRSLADDRGIAQIFISHDLGSIAGITDRVAVMSEGRIVETGPTQELIANPRHPYTRRLLEAVPRISDASSSLNARRSLDI